MRGFAVNSDDVTYCNVDRDPPYPPIHSLCGIAVLQSCKRNVASCRRAAGERRRGVRVGARQGAVGERASCVFYGA